MKKASKVLGLLLVAVMVLGIFTGCGLFTKKTDEYRATAAIQVGEETITIGKLIDTFNNNYNSYYSYIAQGYVTVDYVLEMTVSSLYSQYMKLDAYKTASGVQTYTHANSFGLKNAEYVTDEELSYVVSYIKYLLFTTLDEMVQSYMEIDGIVLNDEEAEDTSRDFVEFDDLGGSQTYSDYTYAQNLKNEDKDEYVSKYYPTALSGDNMSIEGYVYATEAAAQAMLDNLNERVDDEDTQITFAQLQEWQKLALAQYKQNVLRTYKYNVDALVARQAEDMIVSLIVAKYNHKVYSAIDTTNLAETKTELNKIYQELKANQAAKFQVNNDFVSFIEGLTDTSYILNVPANYNYIFVKNILIPFTEEQKVLLTNLEKQLGSTEDSRYVAKRNEFASQVIADDFLSEKDEDGNYAKVENLFKMDGDKVVVNDAGALGAYLKADGTVTAMDGKTQDETIVELMKQYNTDVGQHSTVYDYVVRVHADDIPGYTAKWVPEFVDAANEAYDLAGANEGGTYAIAISTYGVHIVYYSAKVRAQELDFDANIFKTDSVEYRMFKNYFNTQSSLLTEEDAETLKNTYYAGKITKLSGFDKFLKDNNFEFDFEKSISLEDEEE